MDVLIWTILQHMTMVEISYFVMSMLKHVSMTKKTVLKALYSLVIR